MEPDWATCLAALDAAIADPAVVPDGLLARVARLHRIARKRRRARGRAVEASPDERRLADDPRRAVEGSVLVPAGRARCYVCRRRLEHPSRPWLCAACGESELARRAAPLDLAGRRALVTGGRAGLGPRVALRLLRAGAEVHVVTRFPDVAAARFRAEPDAAAWFARLHVHGVDLRDMAAVEGLGDRLAQLPSLEILVHNAARTNPVPRELPGADAANTWMLRVGEVPTAEVLDVLVINAAAPLVLTGRLLPALERSPFPDRHVVLVVGADGRFHAQKTDRHVHVNMSKAALHMLTRTCAASLAERRVYLNSVDPGWLSDERPPGDRAPPLDWDDGASRVLDPIARGRAGAPVWGMLWRNLEPALW